MSDEIKNVSSAPTTELQGNIGTFSLIMSVVAFSAPLMTVCGVCPLMLAYGGNSAPVTYFICMIVLILFSIGFVKMGLYMQNPGGFYAYISAGLGREPGLGAAFLAVIGYFFAGFVGPCYFPMVLTNYIRNLGGPDIPWWIIGIIYMLLIIFLDYRKVDLSARVLTVVMFAECIVVIVFDIVSFIQHPGAVNGGIGLSLPNITDPASQFGVSMNFIFGTFFGFEGTIIYREEVRNPNKTLPRACILTVLFIGIFYGLSTWAFVAFYGADAVQSIAAGNIDTLFETSMVALFGRIVMDVITIMVLFSMFASTLSVVNISSRYLYSLGKDGVLPGFLGSVHQKHASPYAAVLVVGSIYTAAVILLGVFGLEPLTVYPRVSGIGTFCIMLLICIAAVSIVAYFRRNPLEERCIFSTLIAPIIGIIGVCTCTYFALANYGDLIGGGIRLSAIFLILTVAAFIFGLIYAFHLKKNRPEIYLNIGRQRM